MPDDKTKGRDWMDRAQELTKDFHVREQVQRLMEPMRLIHGTKDVRTFDEVLQDVAQLIALLELNPEQRETANVGGISVARGPMQGYSIMLWSADVYVMHMGQKVDENGRQLDERNWRKGMDYWNAGQEARQEARSAQTKEPSSA